MPAIQVDPAAETSLATDESRDRSDMVRQTDTATLSDRLLDSSLRAMPFAGRLLRQQSFKQELRTSQELRTNNLEVALRNPPLYVGAGDGGGLRIGARGLRRTGGERIGWGEQRTAQHGLAARFSPQCDISLFLLTSTPCQLNRPTRL
eukprot:988530-Prorocentrum_minimum.AAC.3